MAATRFLGRSVTWFYLAVGVICPVIHMTIIRETPGCRSEVGG
jgi:hypothetical protein